ncbi:hypothetical protein C8J57DRAFT_1713408 [Mycena rebaudengoi]|nr:hypothetical protein C8J57DRAFT_1713408 [Mycena rebaudengoi]
MSAPGSGSDSDFVTPADSEGPLDIKISPGSRHHKLLTTNEPPDLTNVTLIKQAVLKSDARLAFLDKEIPAEILSEIFLLTLPPRVQGTVLSTIGDSPWVLTHVCRSWREVAVSAPFLWSRVAIDYSRKDTYSIPMIETQIQRANMLRIYFWGGFGRYSDVGHQVKMLQCLMAHSSRWKELTIGVTEYNLPLLATLGGSLPSLCRVWIQWDEDSTRGQTINCFEAAPSLRDITIFNKGASQFRVLLPAQQLTKYETTLSDWKMHRAILPSAPNLVEARIETPESAPFPGDSGEIIELLHLRRLFVSTVDILDYLKAPALEEIGLNLGSELNRWRTGAANDDSGNVDLLPHLDPFVIRSSCTLHKLCLRGSPHTLRVAEILEQYPSIISFATISSNPRAIISCLTVPNNATTDHTLSPQLTEICIGAGFPIDWADYITMLESRWKVEGRALQSATTAFVGSRPNRAQRAHLDALRKDGLDISLVEGENACNAMNAWVYVRLWT